jgi:predicted Ser/Thr protein kinase
MRFFGSLVLLFLGGCNNSSPSASSPSIQTDNEGGSTSSPKVFTDQYSPEVIESVKYFNRKHSELQTKFAKVSDDDYYRDACPPFAFRVDGATVRLGKEIYNADSSSVYEVAGGTKVIKVTERESLAMSWRDDAALRTIAKSCVSNIAPKIGGSNSLPMPCSLRSIVMDFVEGKSLDRLFDNIRLLTLEEMVTMALGALKTLEQLHSIGLVHGDVHAGNFIFEEKRKKMTLIDFGRAIPYVDESGKHVLKSWKGLTAAEQDLDLNPLILSIGELKGFAVSRRDDLFRLAECLVTAFDGQEALLDKLSADVYMMPEARVLIARKVNRRFSNKVPHGFVKLYRATVNMDFNEDPDYATLASLIQST